MRPDQTPGTCTLELDPKEAQYFLNLSPRQITLSMYFFIGMSYIGGMILCFLSALRIISLFDSIVLVTIYGLLVWITFFDPVWNVFKTREVMLSMNKKVQESLHGKSHTSHRKEPKR